ncbi:MAG: hypothetical protein GEU26_15565 [Nitrososphaeraceae archaeon]|nr:hypothetical protein [Nitrososphaeraceae archaeon]
MPTDNNDSFSSGKKQGFLSNDCQVIVMGYFQSRSSWEGPSNPKNGHQRVVTNNDGVNHLQVFVNGSWWHDFRCKEHTNKDCRTK